MSGNTSEIGDVGGSPGKSSLFFLTVQWTLESDCPAIRFSGWEILIPFPFDRRNSPKTVHLETDFSYLLGSANPCLNAIHMETFPTSVYKVLICIFATTTKICTRDRFTQAHAKRFGTISTLSYTARNSIFPCRFGIGNSLKRHPFSGLRNSAGELLHTP